MIISELDRPVLDSRDKSGKTHIHMANIDTLPSGPKGLPIVGNTLQFRRDPLHFVRKMQQAYGRMATVHFGKLPVVQNLRHVCCSPLSYSITHHGLYPGSLLFLNHVSHCVPNMGCV